MKINIRVVLERISEILEFCFGSEVNNSLYAVVLYLLNLFGSEALRRS